MDLYVHGAPGPGVGATAGPGIAFGTNGATPFSANPPTPPCPGYFTPGAIDLDSGDPVFVQLYYMKSNLSVFMEDQSTLATFSTNLQVNLPSLVGGNVAYIGFTAADGGVTSIQTITDFSYSYTTPPVLSIARGTPGNVVVSWPVSVASAFTLYQSSSLSGPWTASNVSSLTQTGCENSVTLPYSGAIQYFLLSLDQPTF